jgi:hypothetical protein
MEVSSNFDSCASFEPFSRIGRQREGQAYEPLLATDSIRLLELLPGENKDPIIIRLQPRNLGATPEYEAISYVWGDQSSGVEITCNGRL